MWRIQASTYLHMALSLIRSTAESQGSRTSCSTSACTRHQACQRILKVSGGSLLPQLLMQEIAEFPFASHGSAEGAVMLP